jgi:hypothetical protein
MKPTPVELSDLIKWQPVENFTIEGIDWVLYRSDSIQGAVLWVGDTTDGEPMYPEFPAFGSREDALADAREVSHDLATDARNVAQIRARARARRGEVQS